MSFSRDDLAVMLQTSYQYIDNIIQIAAQQADNVIVTRTGKVSTIGETSLVLKPHDNKEVEANIIGLYDMIPIDTIKEIIILNYE